VHGHRRTVGGLLAGLLALLGIGIAIPLNVVGSYLPSSVTGHRPLWIGLLACAAIVVVVLTWLSYWQSNRPAVVLSQVPPVAGWVDRAELAEVLSALKAGGSEGAALAVPHARDDSRAFALHPPATRTVALTTGLVGAGGFGKTMLAARACRDRAIRRRFRGGVVWVTIGRDLRGALLAARLGEVCRNLGGQENAFASPEQAGHALAASLAGRGRTLVVADDVWTADQLAPFLAVTQVTRLLVTTRRPLVLAGVDARSIKIDAVTLPVARRLLGRDLPPIAGHLERKLLELAGGWPLLLSLINCRIANDLRSGGSIDTAALDAANKLGPHGTGPHALDITDSGDRQTAVVATLDYSLDVLEETDRDRFLELGIFAEDAEISVAVVKLLWHGTAALSPAETEALCQRLDGLALLSLSWAEDERVIVLHDVIRDFAAAHLGAARRVAAHAALIKAARQLAVTGAAAGTSRSPADGGTPWWRLPESDECRYLWQNLTYHLKAADLETELDQVCCDLRFMATRLRRSGPAAVEADLSRSVAPVAARLRRAVAQNAHLLGPIEPVAALTTILTSRLESVPEVAPQLPALNSDLRAWTAWPGWPLPDQPPGTLVRTLTHRRPVLTVVIAPDGSWLATGGNDGTARIWDTDGHLRADLAGHPGHSMVEAVAIAPDGTWLATGGNDGTARIWDADGHLRADLAGHSGSVETVAIAPDGTWLATGSADRTALIWGADGFLHARLTGHTNRVRAVAISPDGTWVATASWDKTVRIWTQDGHACNSLTGHTDRVRAVAISPDGTWLATGGEDGTVRIWGADGSPRAVLAGHRYPVNAVAISPDGTWLATGGGDKTTRIWGADGSPRAVLAGHRYPVNAVAISPDGSWLATTSWDGTARIWARDGTAGATLGSHRSWVHGVAISPDGTWLATAGGDGTVRIWQADGTPDAGFTSRESWIDAVATSPDGTWLATGGRDGTVRTWTADGTLRVTLTGHVSNVNAVAISPDGTWLATAGNDETARIWAADGTLRATLTGHSGHVNSVAISPDGTRLVTAGEDGTIRIWEPDGRSRTTIDCETGPVNAVAISPDGTWLATAGGDDQSIRTVRIWAADGGLRATLSGHTDKVNAVAISSDGSWLATGGNDRKTRIWDFEGTLRATLTGHTGTVDTVAISQDGTWLATGSDDGTVKIWAANGGDSPQNVSAIRVDGAVSSCAWRPRSLGLYIAGPRGFYQFSLRAPRLGNTK
jgi:WD40 repeat protein